MLYLYYHGQSLSSRTMNVSVLATHENGASEEPNEDGCEDEEVLDLYQFQGEDYRSVVSLCSPNPFLLLFCRRVGCYCISSCRALVPLCILVLSAPTEEEG